MNKSIVSSCTSKCGHCSKIFTREIAVVIDGSSQNDYYDKIFDYSLFIAKCPECGFSPLVQHIFVYHNSKCNQLYVVYPDDNQIYYGYVQETAKSYLEEYKKSLDQEELLDFENTQMKFTTLTAFLNMLKPPTASTFDVGFIHFYPFPKVDLDTFENAKKLNTPSMNIKVNEVYLKEDNYPDLFRELLDLAEQYLNFDRYFIDINVLKHTQTPVASYGVPEIVLIAGSTIIIPILVSTISLLLKEIIINKFSAKKKHEKELSGAYEIHPIKEQLIKNTIALQDNLYDSNDKIIFKIQDTKKCMEYTFEGTVANVVETMDSFVEKGILTTYLPGECHMANYMDNLFSDCSMEDINSSSIADMYKTYGKYFSSDTRVRFVAPNECDYIYLSSEACARAKYYIEHKNYEKAVQILSEVFNGDNTTIEVFYNYGLCLLGLGEKQKAIECYKELIKRSINLPSIKDTANFKLGLDENEKYAIRVKNEKHNDSEIPGCNNKKEIHVAKGKKKYKKK